jgi:acyl-CoA synthetase (NDP forming)
MKGRLGSTMTGALLQPMAGDGVELIAGIVRDDTFGPLIVFGMGGTMAELIGDRAVRVAPIADAEAREVVGSLRCSPLLTGYRGSDPVDVSALADLLVRLGLLARDVPEIAELDLNPVIAKPGGIVTVDARVRVSPPTSNSDSTAVRRLAPPRPVER